MEAACSFCDGLMAFVDTAIVSIAWIFFWGLLSYVAYFAYRFTKEGEYILALALMLVDAFLFAFFVCLVCTASCI